MAFATGAHISTVVNNSQASANPLAGIRRTHACERLQEKALRRVQVSSKKKRLSC